MTARRPVKVLHVLHSLGMGGAETWLLELLRLWAATGVVEMHFLATGGCRGVFDDEVVRLGGTVHYNRYGRDRLARFTREFRKLLDRERFDAIHDHGDIASGWHFLLGLGVLPPVRIAHVHNAVMHLEVNYKVGAFRRLAATAGRLLVSRMATHICATSAKAIRDYKLEARAGGPIVLVVHCGFEVDRFNAAREPDRSAVLREFDFPQSTRLILFAGRLDEALEIGHPQNSKNSWLALLSGRAAAEADPDVRLLMAGAGDVQRSTMEHQIAEWGLNDQLRLIGVRRDLPSLLRAADVVLFPSVDEGLGMVAVEAQAAGTPVLTSDTIADEAIVVPALFHRKSLAAPPDEWGATLLEVMAQPRPDIADCRRRLLASPFAITRSAATLERIYRASLADPDPRNAAGPLKQ